MDEKEMLQQELYNKCPYMVAQKLLSGKWSILILCYLRNGPMRFSELGRYMHALNQTTLTKQLRKLEDDKLIERKVYPVVPPRVEYSLSEIGWEITEVLDAISRFGMKYIKYVNKDNGEGCICEEAGKRGCICSDSYSPPQKDDN